MLFRLEESWEHAIGMLNKDLQSDPSIKIVMDNLPISGEDIVLNRVNKENALVILREGSFTDLRSSLHINSHEK